MVDRIVPAATGVGVSSGKEGFFVKREPIFNVPTVVLMVLAVLVAVHVALEGSSADTASEMMMRFGFVPGDLTERLFGGIFHRIAELSNANPEDLSLASSSELADYLASNPSYLPLSFISYGFIHANWTHLLINSAWLLAFGSVVARRIGAIRFLILLFASAVGGAALHWVTHLDEVMPVIGASGAVSGIMAASVRFAFQPGESLSGFSLHASGSYRAPALPLLRTLRDKRTLRFILLWLGVNIITGLIGVPLGLTEGGIAWEAHIGGFLVGLLLFNFVDPPILVQDLYR
jgi:membrane associated rhomboid family serine protease